MLIFDEPVNGLDPEGIRWVRGLFRGLAAEGRTVLVSSHLAAAFAIGLLVCNADVGQWPRMSPAARATLDPMADSFVGFSVAQLIFAAIGVLTVTSEYSSGLIRTTFSAVPARRAVLAAKAAVVCLVTVAVGLITALTSFAAGQAILSQQHTGISLGHPGAGRAVIATALYLVAVALLGMGLGVLIRNAAGALHRRDA